MHKVSKPSKGKILTVSLQVEHKRSLTYLRRIVGAVAFGACSVLAPVPSQATTPEDAPIAALDNAIIATMKASAADASYQSRYHALKPILDSTYNFPVVLENSVGFLWPTLPSAQQDELRSVFGQYTAANYIENFKSYAGQKIEILPGERSVGDMTIVETQLVPADGSAPTRIDYVMKQGASGWQITDVLLNGTISKVAVQSSDFSSLVTNGDASNLIAALQNKVRVLSRGQ
jgi:phospholipid transport system substrate-binding protein